MKYTKEKWKKEGIQTIIQRCWLNLPKILDENDKNLDEHEEETVLPGATNSILSGTSTACSLLIEPWTVSAMVSDGSVTCSTFPLARSPLPALFLDSGVSIIFTVYRTTSIPVPQTTSSPRIEKMTLGTKL